jgi:hypothetical protein
VEAASQPCESGAKRGLIGGPPQAFVFVLLAVGLFFGGRSVFPGRWALAVTPMAVTIIFFGSCCLSGIDCQIPALAVPVVLQLSVALGWSVGSQYLLSEAPLRSPERIFMYFACTWRRIAQLDFSLKPAAPC